MWSSVAPLTDYFNSPIYQELLDEEDYFGGKSDERMHLDLRVSSGYVNETATKKIRLTIWAYSLGEYRYILLRNGLTLRHRTYSINQDDKDLLEWEENNLLKKASGTWEVQNKN